MTNRTAYHEIVEASTLGLAPGFWPRFVVYGGVQYGSPRQVRAEGELVSIVYVAYRWGYQRMELEVLND